MATEEYDVRSAASILASVKEQEARFERLTRALEEERRHVSLQLERANLPCGDRLPWQQVVMQVSWANHMQQGLPISLQHQQCHLRTF